MQNIILLIHACNNPVHVLRSPARYSGVKHKYYMYYYSYGALIEGYIYGVFGTLHIISTQKLSAFSTFLYTRKDLILLLLLVWYLSTQYTYTCVHVLYLCDPRRRSPYCRYENRTFFLLTHTQAHGRHGTERTNGNLKPHLLRNNY